MPDFVYLLNLTLASRPCVYAHLYRLYYSIIQKNRQPTQEKFGLIFLKQCVDANIFSLDEANLYMQTKHVRWKGRMDMPLTMMGIGESRPIMRIGGSAQVRAHLENLGFVEGETIRVVSDISGNLIVQVKDARVAISKELAVKILV